MYIFTVSLKDSFCLQHGDNCEECEAGCQKPRPEGCTHSCPTMKCHPGPCPPCKQMLRMRCHCQISVQHVQCDDWIKNLEKRESLQSCGGECPKLVISNFCLMLLWVNGYWYNYPKTNRKLDINLWGMLSFLFFFFFERCKLYFNSFSYY